MGQIQNAVSGVVGSVAVGAIAEQKTKGMKKEISELNEYMGLNAELIEDQQAEIFKQKEELDKIQARHSEVKGQLAEMNAKKEQEASAKGKEKFQRRLAFIQSKQLRGKR